jgi:hypothetical protein
MTFRNEEQDRITRRGLAAARAALAAAGRHTDAAETPDPQPHVPNPERRNP